MENCLHPPPILGLDTDVIKIMMKNPTGSSNGGDEQRDNDELKASRSSDFDVTQFCDKENEMKQIQFFEKLAKRWKSISDHDEHDFVLSFLKGNGKHHMNWSC